MVSSFWWRHPEGHCDVTISPPPLRQNCRFPTTHVPVLVCAVYRFKCPSRWNKTRQVSSIMLRVMLKIIVIFLIFFILFYAYLTIMLQLQRGLIEKQNKTKQTNKQKKHRDLPARISFTNVSYMQSKPRTCAMYSNPLLTTIFFFLFPFFFCRFWCVGRYVD